MPFWQNDPAQRVHHLHTNGVTHQDTQPAPHRQCARDFEWELMEAWPGPMTRPKGCISQTAQGLAEVSFQPGHHRQAFHDFPSQNVQHIAGGDILVDYALGSEVM